MSRQKISIGVIGSGDPVSTEIESLAYETGKYIANNGAVLVCGGRGGVMEAASSGAAENGGSVLGILPSDSKADANPWVDIALPSGFGIGRNALVVQASDAIIAFPGSYGTLSEIGLALNCKKTVVYFPGTWNLKKIAAVDSAYFIEVHDAREAIGCSLNAVAARAAAGPIIEGTTKNCRSKIT